MVELNAIPNIPLKIIFSVHFILITWGIQGNWSPDSYLFYNLFFLLVLLWAIHSKDSEEPLQIAIFMNGISVILDVFTVSLFFHRILGLGDRFSFLMAIVNLVFRPISILLLGKICAERMGIADGAFPASFASIFGPITSASSAPGQRNSYEDIDTFAPSSHRHQPPHHQSVPETVYQQP